MLQQETKLLVKILDEHVAFSERHVNISTFKFLGRGHTFGGVFISANGASVRHCLEPE
jgi:hypothetical protein